MEIKEIILWIAIGILALCVIYLTFFRGNIDSSAVSSVGQAASSYSGMVGGC